GPGSIPKPRDWAAHHLCLNSADPSRRGLGARFDPEASGLGGSPSLPQQCRSFETRPPGQVRSRSLGTGRLTISASTVPILRDEASGPGSIPKPRDWAAHHLCLNSADPSRRGLGARFDPEASGLGGSPSLPQQCRSFETRPRGQVRSRSLGTGRLTISASTVPILRDEASGPGSIPKPRDWAAHHLCLNSADPSRRGLGARFDPEASGLGGSPLHFSDLSSLVLPERKAVLDYVPQPASLTMTVAPNTISRRIWTRIRSSASRSCTTKFSASWARAAWVWCMKPRIRSSAAA